MRSFLLLLAIAASVDAASLLVNQPGTAVAAGTWVQGPQNGYSAQVQIVGYSRLTCAEAVKACVMLENAPATNSEYQHAMLKYSFATGRWDILDQAADWHSDYMWPANHPVGYQAWNPLTSQIYYWGSGACSQALDCYPYTLWVYDPVGRAGHPIYSTIASGSTDPSTNQSTGMEYDPYHATTALVDGSGGAAGQVYTWADSAQQWVKQIPTCYLFGNATPSASYCPYAGIYFPGTAFNAVDGYMYLFGGYHGTMTNALWRYSVAANTWTLMTQDGASGSPSARAFPALSWDTRRNLMLMVSGCTTTGTCAGTAIGDTWIYDPVANAWTQQFPPQTYTNSLQAFNGLSYDEPNDVFVLALSTVSFIPQMWFYRLDPGSNYAYNTYTPYAYQPATAAYSLNYSATKTTPQGTPGNPTTGDSWARNPSLAVNGSNLYETHPEYGRYALTSSEKWPWPYATEYSGATPVSTVPTSNAYTSIAGTLATSFQSASNVLTAYVASGTYAGQWVAYDSPALYNNCWGATAINASASSGSTALSVSGVTGAIFGSAYVFGPGIQAGTTATAVTGGEISGGGTGTVTLSLATTAPLSGATVYFSLPSGASCQLVSAGKLSSTTSSVSVVPYDGTALMERPVALKSCNNTPTMVVQASDRTTNPYSTWQYVKQWNGLAWVNLGGQIYRNIDTTTATNQTNAFDASLSCDAAGNPWIAWNEAYSSTNYWYKWAETPQVYVAQWNGSAWVGADGTTALHSLPSLNNSTANWATDPSLTVIGATPYVAWGERSQTGPNLIYSKTWTGSAWVALGANPINRNTNTTNNGSWGNPVYPFAWATHARLTNDGTNVWATWTEQQGPSDYSHLYVSEYVSGTGWQSIGGAPAANQDGSAANATIAMYSGQPIVAWDESKPGGLRQVYLAEYNQTSGSFAPLITTVPAGSSRSGASSGLRTSGVLIQ